MGFVFPLNPVPPIGTVTAAIAALAAYRAEGHRPRAAAIDRTHDWPASSNTN
jgi:hypothetical protein